MAYGIPVSDLLQGRAWNTLVLSLSALALCWVVAVPLGVWSAARPRGWTDRFAGSAATVFLSLPDLLAGLLALVVTVRLGIVTVNGRFFPAVVALACLAFPAVFRHTRSSMQQALVLPFVEHLRACGVTEGRILFVHAARAAANPMISLLGLSFAGLTSSSLVIEVTLNWPGLGPLLLESILARDMAVVLAAVLLAAVCMLLGNLVADLMLYAADPRIRREAP
ncbi:MAG: ABC transporter permease [Bryobacterales bacterium]|nr:ABC transporter permease [Bryobacterales bacterium]